MERNHLNHRKINDSVNSFVSDTMNLILISSENFCFKCFLEHSLSSLFFVISLVASRNI